MNLYSVIKNTAVATDAVNVGFSTGKDSLVVLDLCHRFIGKINLFFMYFVPDLEFQERYLRYIEDKYSTKIIRLPHWCISDLIQSGSYRPQTQLSMDCPRIEIADIEREISARTGCHWFAYGQKNSDSLERNAMLKKCQGIDRKTHRIFPIMWFSDKAVFAYLKQHRIRLPRDYELWGTSFGRLWAPELSAIKTLYPSDYEKIRSYFPHIEVVIKRAEFGQSISEV